jgi:sialate O-acetylesterase
MKLLTHVCLGLLSVTLAAGVARAEVKLPSIFSDHMVVQRDQPIPIWGWAAAGEKVTVTLGDKSTEAVAGADGKWSAKLAQQSSGGPLELRVKGTSNEVFVKDVLVGEVWLCSGQSNMAMAVNRALNFEQEQAAANHPRIRHFKVAGGASAEPREDCQGTWEVCSADTVGGFSATAYFFGREVQRATGVPVGLINSSVGGTPIDSWISQEAQQSDPNLKPLFETIAAAKKAVNTEAVKAKYEKDLAAWKEAAKQAKAAGQTPPRAPRDPIALAERKGDVGGLYNGMIAPVIAYGFRGAIWYQGEANSTPEKAGYYQFQLPLLVKDWRARHGGGDFPFGWVQLPNYGGAGRNWPVVREAMFKALAVPHTGMAVTMDVGETKDIHPKNKQEAGRRLAQWALADVYGQKVAGSGPRYSGYEVKDGKVLISFTQADGLALSNAPDSPLVLAIAGADRQWKPAQGTIEGGKLVVSSPEVAAPAAVRYLWSNDPPAAPLKNGAGLLASPFRTDDWSEATPLDQSEPGRAR